MKKVVPRKLVSRVDCEDRDFAAVFNVIAQRRARALMSVNVEMLLTNWEVGAFLSQRVHTGSWSTAVVGRLADYIKRNDPTLKGYGKSNLYKWRWSMTRSLRRRFWSWRDDMRIC